MTILTEDLDGNNMIRLEGHPVTNQINTCNLLVFLTVLNDCSFIYYITWNKGTSSASFENTNLQESCHD